MPRIQRPRNSGHFSGLFATISLEEQGNNVFLQDKQKACLLLPLKQQIPKLSIPQL